VATMIFFFRLEPFLIPETNKYLTRTTEHVPKKRNLF